MVLKWIFLSMYYTVLGYVYNIEEIEHLKYGIDINSKPILRSELHSVEHVIMKSKYNQEYSCILPKISTKDQTDQSLEDILKTLSSKFTTSSCIERTKGWWTYKLCYGDVIKQYHQEDASLKSQVPEEFTVIGRYEKDMNWTEKLESKKVKYYEQLPHAHKQYFTNGDLCEETGLPRKATVSYACDPDARHDFIALIDERELCVYRIVVHTPTMCRHELFMPGHAGVKHAISCSPIVSGPVRVITKKQAAFSSPKVDSTQPNWVGAFPTTEFYTFRDYIDDITHSRAELPSQALKKMLREILSNINIKDLKVTAKKNAGSDLTLDDLANEDLDKILESKEVENVVREIAESAKKEMNMIKKKPPIEIKVVYRDADGNVKISDADGTSPEVHDTVLQLMNAGVEEEVEMKRHKKMQDAYKYIDNTRPGDSTESDKTTE